MTQVLEKITIPYEERLDMWIYFAFRMWLIHITDGRCMWLHLFWFWNTARPWWKSCRTILIYMAAWGRWETSVIWSHGTGSTNHDCFNSFFVHNRNFFIFHHCWFHNKLVFFCALILIMIKSTNEIDLIVKQTFEKCFDHGYVPNQQ